MECSECGTAVAECERLLTERQRYCCAVCCILKDTHKEKEPVA